MMADAKRERAPIAVVILVVLALLCAYVLSIGPVAYYSSVHNDGDWLRYTYGPYYPVFWICDRSEWCDLLMRRYVGWCHIALHGWLT